LNEKIAELQDFRENKTLEAYFSRFKFARDEKTRIELINQVKEFLDSKSEYPSQTEAGKCEESNASVLLGDCHSSL
jgi:hypothetical protein